MNVGTLRDLLSQYPDDLDIILSSDEEGNSYGELRTLQSAWTQDDGYDIDVLHPQDANGYITEEMEIAGVDRATAAENLGFIRRLIVWP